MSGFEIDRHLEAIRAERKEQELLKEAIAKQNEENRLRQIERNKTMTLGIVDDVTGRLKVREFLHELNRRVFQGRGLLQEETSYLAAGSSASTTRAEFAPPRTSTTYWSPSAKRELIIKDPNTKRGYNLECRIKAKIYEKTMLGSGELYFGATWQQLKDWLVDTHYKEESMSINLRYMRSPFYRPAGAPANYDKYSPIDLEAAIWVCSRRVAEIVDYFPQTKR